MVRRIAWTRAGACLSCLLLFSLGAPSAALAQAGQGNVSPPPTGAAGVTPGPSGVVGTSDWLPGSPAAADSAAADSAATRSAPIDAGPEDAAPRDSLPGGPAPAGLGPAGETAGGSASPAADSSLRLPANIATGVSVGYPAWPGLFILAPADGSFGFRSGLTGFPTIGLLWTPGMEYRFGQESGTLSRDGVYTFGNAFLGRSYWDGDETEYIGAEAGLGYRWFIDDRRGVRWIAAAEAGGYWRGDPLDLQRVCVRFIWTLVE